MKTINVTFEDQEYKELIKKKLALQKKFNKNKFTFSWQKFIIYLNKQHNGGFKKTRE